MDDNEIRQGDWSYIYMERRISDVDYCGVPEYKEEPQSPSVSEPVEEQCGCGKMKDAGRPCWWCGHNE